MALAANVKYLMNATSKYMICFLIYLRKSRDNWNKIEKILCHSWSYRCIGVWHQCICCCKANLKFLWFKWQLLEYLLLINVLWHCWVLDCFTDSVHSPISNHLPGLALGSGLCSCLVGWCMLGDVAVWGGSWLIGGWGIWLIENLYIWSDCIYILI